MYDRGPALVASQISNAHGMKTSATDFMPYGREVRQEIDISEFIGQAFGGKVLRGR